MDSVGEPENSWTNIVSRASTGEALSLRLRHTQRSRDRARSAIRRILGDPIIQAGLRRILDEVGPAEPPPDHRDPNGKAGVVGPPTTDPGASGRIVILGVGYYGSAVSDDELRAAMRRDDAEVADWNQRHAERASIVRERCRTFSSETPCAHASPPNVAWVMERALNDSWSHSPDELASILAAEYAGPAPTAYVNPLPDRDLAVAVRPGRILIDLTHATESDLRDLVKPLAQLRAMLGYHNDPGGRPRGGTTWTREQFLEELPRAIAAFEARHGRKPVDTELASEMGISKSSFVRYKKRFLLNAE